MPSLTLPLVILGGRDRRGSELPEEGHDKHPIHGYKAVDLRIGGRPLISLLLERLRACGCFDPILLAGPERVYRPVCPDLPMVDTDGSFGQNIRAAFEALEGISHVGHVAFTTCDVLPEPKELRALLADFETHRDLDFWMPQIRVPRGPEALGESGWKPRYRLVPEGETEAVDSLPGHLIVVDPKAVRSNLLFRLFDLSYQTRNRPVAYRRAVIARHVMLNLVLADLRLLARLELPTATWDIVLNGLAIARGLRAGTMTAEELAHRVRKVYIRRSHRRRHPERKGRMPVLAGLSLAKDVDTEEEARELAQRLSTDPGPEENP
ncbi:MAG: nucleotidyltransferase family protein [Acidobacteria bacterium]|nr:nucleotidyltransferase family protein [Acidobacteriota bacterium]